MISFRQRILLHCRWVMGLYIFLALFATAQAIFSGHVINKVNGLAYTRYNNYLIFKQSYYHLLSGQDLYLAYPLEHWDLYKYSPAFSLLFGFLALQPDFTGLLCWQLLNAGVLFFAIYYLPQLDVKAKVLLLLAIAVELLTSLQNEQSNALTAGLLILAFGLLERRHYCRAAFCIVFSIYIKLFGLVACVLFLFYPQKWKLALYTALWFLFFLLLPLLVVDAAQLRIQYYSWFRLLTTDYSQADGFSVMGWLKTWFHLNISKRWVVAAGALLFLLPLTRIPLYRDYYFRLMVLASLLIWVIIFNHKAESPSFIIAMSGVGLWYFVQPHKKENQVLFVLAILFTVLASTDIYPKFIRDDFFKPYLVKVVPCILVWCKLNYDLVLAWYRPPLPESPDYRS